MNISSVVPPHIIAVPATNPVALKTKPATQLSEEERRQLQQLKARDREVRTHEAAHVAAAHGLIKGGTHFSYQKGPDGVRYAVGGDVTIDTTADPDNPQATLEKARLIQTAALAPTQPSAQDKSVAAKAAQMAIQARAEINQQQTADTLSS